MTDVPPVLTGPGGDYQRAWPKQVKPKTITKPCIDRAQAIALLRQYRREHGRMCMCQSCQFYFALFGDHGVPSDA